jgi:peptidoglycan/xylan/chitin deacetylase (PgdA/CDA1 family)
VDVDSLYLYYRLHGFEADEANNAVWTAGVRRFAELFKELGVRATFFVVGQDLERWPEARQIARELVEAGHELGSHTWSHPYDLTRKTPEEIGRELDQAQTILSEVAGETIRGFRAPGYTITEPVFAHLRQRGYTYDSSLFPCPPYYLAKAAVMGLMKLRGKRSDAILDSPSILWQSRVPHWRAGIRELPITVLPGLRAPFIGTSLLMMGRRGYRAIRPWVRATGFVNLEFHGIDLCDLKLDGIDPILLKQPDLRVSLEDKLDLFREVIGDLRDHRELDTLESLAPRLVPGPAP